jgi:hypothetical protein
VNSRRPILSLKCRTVQPGCAEYRWSFRSPSGKVRVSPILERLRMLVLLPERSSLSSGVGGGRARNSPFLSGAERSPAPEVGGLDTRSSCLWASPTGRAEVPSVESDGI